jgi:four helix bundle protein
MPILCFEDIEGWQLARELTRQVYSVASRGEFAKDFGLRDQITRAAGSTMHNIAEGFDGGSNPEFIKFLRYSQRSCSEIQSQLYVALDQATLAKRSSTPSTPKRSAPTSRSAALSAISCPPRTPTPSNQEPRTPDHKLLPLYHELRTKNQEPLLN